jgi:hypothetical protein
MSPPISLTTPLAQSPIQNVAIVSLVVTCGAGDGATVARITYGPSDANGNLLPGANPSQLITVTLAPADELVFVNTPGSFRVRAQAALQSNEAALAGTST